MSVIDDLFFTRNTMLDEWLRPAGWKYYKTGLPCAAESSGRKNTNELIPAIKAGEWYTLMDRSAENNSLRPGSAAT